TVGTLTIPAGTPIDVLLAAPIAVGGLDLFNPTTGVFRSQPVTTTIKNPAMMTVGLAYKVGNGWTLLGDYQLTWWSQFDPVDLAYQYIRQNDRRGRTREPLSGPATTGMNNGLYTFHAHLFGVSLGYAF